SESLTVVFPILADILLKGTIVLLTAFAAAWALRRASAATRHLVWSAAMLSLLVLPVLSLTLPRWNVPLALPWTHTATPENATLEIARPKALTEELLASEPYGSAAASLAPAPSASTPAAPPTPAPAANAAGKSEPLLVASRETPPATALGIGQN